MRRSICLAAAAMLSTIVQGAEIHVSPAGDDSAAGSASRPLKTFSAAQQAARKVAGKEPVTVFFQSGIYYLPETIRFTARDSGAQQTPVVFAAAPGAKPVLSGGTRLQLQWQAHKDGIFKVPAPEGLEIDQLFVNGARQHMARYPDFDPNQRIMNGFAADAFSKERAARWANPAGGYIHAMHVAHWGGYHYRITGKNDKGDVTCEGGWQNNRQMGMHKQHRYVENIFEELDAPGEWFHDAAAGMLYYFPAKDTDLSKATIEVVRLRHLVEFAGSPEKPVQFVTLKGFIFRHAARTFMDVKEPLLRSDWTIYRGGAIVFNGAQDCAIADCEFDQVGGNTVFVNNFNRRITIKGCLIQNSGGNGVCFVGDPKSVRNPLFEYRQRQAYDAIDRTPGPKTENYPADCVVEDCLIARTGRVEKQSAPIQISMALAITVRHCSIYEVPRAGINISEGTFGGHLIDFCDVFDTVLETGDHGSFNSWGRDRYWGLEKAPADELPKLAMLDIVRPTIIRNSRWRCDHGWDIDLDDGSSNYEIYNNLLLRGGLKLREGFARKAHNNITVNNSLHPHVWYANSGDTVTGNIFMGPHRPAGGMPRGKWGSEIDRNLFTTTDADRNKFAANGCDANSVVGDAMFVDPAKGDYTVKDNSPALRIGFKNFPMNQFGVQKAELKAIARSPELPGTKREDSPATPTSKIAVAHYWHQARVKDLEGEEFSAYGVSKEAGGIVMVELPPGSAALRDGFKADDLIQSVNAKPVRNVVNLLRLTSQAAGQPLSVGIIRGQQPRTIKVESYAFVVTENSADGEFKAIPLAPATEVAQIRRIQTRPATNNEPPAALHDGKLAANYGPVFGNGVIGGIYKCDLGAVRRIASISTWSHNQNGNRGPQRFVLFGSNSTNDPGWNTSDRAAFMPIAEVEATSARPERFCASGVRGANGQSLGSFRWVLWVAYPVTEKQENSAYQEFQVKLAP